MAYELTRKWFRNNQMFIALCFMILVCFCSCDMRAGKYPFQIADNWKCESPEFTLSYSTNVNGQKQERELLTWNEQTIEVNVMFGLGEYCVYPADSTNYSDRLLAGTWKYHNGNLILLIGEDFVFKNQYKELVFLPIS